MSDKILAFRCVRCDAVIEALNNADIIAEARKHLHLKHKDDSKIIRGFVPVEEG